HARRAWRGWTPARSFQIWSEAPERWRGRRRRRGESSAGGGQGREKVNLKQTIDNVATEESFQKGRARRFPLREAVDSEPHHHGDEARQEIARRGHRLHRD